MESLLIELEALWKRCRPPDLPAEAEQTDIPQSSESSIFGAPNWCVRYDHLMVVATLSCSLELQPHIPITKPVRR